MLRTVDDASVRRTHVILYAAFVIAAVAIVLGLLQVGQQLEQAPGAIARLAGAANHDATNLRNPFAVLMLQILAIMLAARACGTVAARCRQPRVVGEIAAGLLLGPSVLGFALPGVSRLLFPAASLPALGLLSQIGVTLFMFGVGLTVDISHLRRKAHAAVAVSHVSILVPFCLGTLLSLALYQRYAPAGVPFRSFALFMGVGMSITAFPVLARIIEERRLTGTPLASIAITCAAVDDVTAWTLLAFVVALVTSGGAWQRFTTTLALTLAFVLFITRYGRRAVQRLLQAAAGRDGVPHDETPIALALLFASALFTETIGIHALFGAFLMGSVLPIDRAARDVLRDRLESVSAMVLLPLFFAFTGLRTDLRLLDHASSWLTCGAIVALATAGKLGGSMLAARASGLEWRVAFGVGALMNTRGLMELVALNIGYELGILAPEIFAMMVLMALTTTMMTGPLLDLAGIGRRMPVELRFRSPVERRAADVADGVG